MKILLVALNAKYIHSNPALYSLRSYSVSKRPEFAQNIAIAEYTINQQLSDILADIYKRKPDMIAFSCYIWNWESMQKLICQVHKVLPRVPLWLGGPEVSFHCEEILEKYPFLTGIMVGEGEATFLELVSSYEEEMLGKDAQIKKMEEAEAPRREEPDFSDINGIVYRDPKKNSIIRTKERELTDISELPFFYDDLGDFKNRILYYESSRGCPFKCSYCLSSIDKKVRIRNLELVKKELQFFLDNQVPQVKFIDRTFNCSHAHAQAIWKYIMEHDNGITNFHFEIAADLLTEEELELLGKMRPGLVQLEIGVQSTNLQTISEIRRVMDVNHLREVVERIHQADNIHIHLDLIAGLPWEDLESFKRSFNDVYAMEPQQLQLGFLKVLKGSYMEEKAADYALSYGEIPPYEVLSTNWLSFEDVLKLKQVEAMVELFYNSNQYTHTLPVLEKCFKTPYELYEKLGSWFEEKGYFINSPSRAYRYQVLLEFSCTFDQEREALYKELLTYDMYLRENLKSRPSFAGEMDYQAAGTFFKKEEETREILPHYKDYNSKQMMRMAHLEAFFYPVWKSADEVIRYYDEKRRETKAVRENTKTVLNELSPKPSYVLFDYMRRSPLTKEAYTEVIVL